MEVWDSGIYTSPWAGNPGRGTTVSLIRSIYIFCSAIFRCVRRESVLVQGLVAHQVAQSGWEMAKLGTVELQYSWYRGEKYAENSHGERALRARCDVSY